MEIAEMVLRNWQELIEKEGVEGGTLADKGYLELAK